MFGTPEMSPSSPRNPQAWKNVLSLIHGAVKTETEDQAFKVKEPMPEPEKKVFPLLKKETAT